MIALLEPIFRGPLAPYGAGLICSTPPASASTLTDLLEQPDLLRELLTCRARVLGTSDYRPVASAWMLTYSMLLLPPVVAATTRLQHAFPLDPKEVALETSDDGNPQRFFIPNEGWSAAGQDTAARYASLIDTHLTPLISRLSEVSRLPRKVLWGNVARRLEFILDQAAALTPSAEIEMDSNYLLQQPLWQDRPNPLLQPAKKPYCRHWATGSRNRFACTGNAAFTISCLDHGYCGACPLSPGFDHEEASLAREAASISR